MTARSLTCLLAATALLQGASLVAGCRCQSEPEPPPERAETTSPARSPDPPTDVAAPTPATAAEPRPARALATGGWHSCAVVTATEPGGADEVVCWGGDDLRQLGADASPSMCADEGYQGPCADTPQRVPTPLGRVLQLATGTATACVLLETSSREVACWGGGPIGVETDARCPRLPAPMPCLDTPTPIDALRGATTLGLGGGHGCAALEPDGHVVCWGHNGDGQLGTTTPAHSVEPIAVDGPRGVTHLATGDRHTCAVGLDAASATALWCWGANDSGQLGDGTLESSAVPAAVDGLPEPPVEIAAGAAHTCARADSGRLWCWGSNRRGQLGDAQFVDQSAPVEIELDGAARELAVGAEHTCVRLDDGRVQCWGANDVGQLGDDSRDDRGAPTPVVALSAVTALAAGARHTCAIAGQGALVSCWGDNRARQLGRRGIVDAQRPAPVTW